MADGIFPVGVVSVLATDENGKIILVHEKGKASPVLFKLPGGRPEHNEIDPLTTAVREFEEECGVAIQKEFLAELATIPIRKYFVSAAFFFYKKPVPSEKLKKGTEIEILLTLTKKQVEEKIAWGDIAFPHNKALEIFCKNS